MIHFEKFILDNGLTVLIHPDHSTPLAVVNVMYNVGARDEDPQRTGFAHLFEHLMFGGSLHIPEYDEPLQMAGGENNAYTTNDLTNYYIQLPVQNIETALWLESDRMLGLAFGEKSLEVQRKVVVEEFKEHYINKPYGDAWHQIRDLAYTVHPYRWMTIGKELSHIENAQLDEVKSFFYKHYTPCNAILVIAGPVNSNSIMPLVNKWFGDIPSGTRYQRQIQPEPPQTAARYKEVKARVPLDAFYCVWHMPARLEDGYYAADLIAEIMGSGGSSRLYQRLVKERQLFSSIACHHLGAVEKGLMAIEGKLVKGIDMQNAEKAVWNEIDLLLRDGVTETELQKAKNKTESVVVFEDMHLMNRAMNLAFYELLGDANLMNTELDRFQAVTQEGLLQVARQIFRIENSNTLRYFAANGGST